MKDNRDPKVLGEELIDAVTEPYRLGENIREVYDKHHLALEACPDYNHEPGPIEKYGDPRLIPSTMPNAVE